MGRHAAGWRAPSAQGPGPWHAIIPPGKDARPCKPSTAGAIARNEALRASRDLGRAIWRKRSGYHRRSRAEPKIECVTLLGQSLSARDFDCRMAELRIRAGVLNGCTALGIPLTEPVAWVRSGQERSTLHVL